MDQTPNQEFREPLVPKDGASKSLPEWPTLEEANSAADTPVLASSMQQGRKPLFSDELSEASFTQEKDNLRLVSPSMESTHISNESLPPYDSCVENADDSNSSDAFEIAFVEGSQAPTSSMEESVVFVEEGAPNLDISFQLPRTKDSTETLELVEDAVQDVNRLKSSLDNSSMGESFVILQPSLPSPDKSNESQAVNRSSEVNDGQLDLPETVTRLQTPYGIPVYLVGTAHFSLASQEDVAKTIRLVQPNVVVVELCKSRVNMLHLDEETILREAKDLNIQKIRITIKQHGAVQGALYLLLLSMSAHITRQLGMAPGGEFRRAFQEAKKLPDCMVHLGDRPIQVTLQRALASLSIWQKIKLAWHLLSSNEPISKEEVEKCKQRDMLEEMLAEMTGEFPALSQVFVQERDIYLAHSVQLAADSLARLVHPENPTKPSVVAVVGIGHVSGIVERFGRVSQDEVLQIMKIPPPSISSRLLTFTVKASICGLALWGCYKVLPVPRISTAWSALSERVGKI